MTTIPAIIVNCTFKHIYTQSSSDIFLKTKLINVYIINKQQRLKNFVMVHNYTHHLNLQFYI